VGYKVPLTALGRIATKVRQREIAFMVVMVRPSRSRWQDMLKRRGIGKRELSIADVAALFAGSVNQFLLAPFSFFASYPFAISTGVMRIINTANFIRL
jgi:hypothetical protein